MISNQDQTSGDTSQAPNSFLKRKCGAIFRQILTIQRQTTQEALQAMDQAELSTRLELLNHILTNFEATQTSLEEENPDELDSSSRTDFLAAYVSIKASITRELKSQRLEPHAHSSTTMFSPNDSQSVVVLKQNKSRLPDLQLPTFTGAFTEWPNFISMFQTVVDNEPELTKIEKFQHLRTCLKGSALDVIRSLEIRESNYDKAMNLLKCRFDNKRLIFQAHIRELLELKGADANTVGSLRVLVDKFTSHIRALQTLGSKTQIADCLLIFIIGQKLDPSTQTKWEEAAAINSIPTWENMEAFLEKRCQTLESINFATVQKTPSAQVSKIQYQKKSLVVSKSTYKLCTFCKKEDHYIYNCPSFIKLTPAVRWKEAKKASLCLNCLRQGHHAQQCKSSNCRRCSAQHNTLLHFVSAQPSVSDCTPEEKLESSVTAAQATALVSKSNNISPHAPLNENVLIATAVILVKTRSGSFIPCHALLDSASQLNFVTCRFANQADLKMTKFSYSVSGIGESDLKISHCANITFKSMHNDYSASLTVAVTPTITDSQPNYTFATVDWNLPANIKLADPLFFKSQRIDMLLGAGIFFDLLCVGQIRVKSMHYILQKTRLGWVVSGGHQTSSVTSSLATVSLSGEEQPPSLSQIVRSFWEIDNCFESTANKTKEEIECEEHFVNNYRRLETGEYSVRLPLKHSLDLLGDSYEQALRRFISLERRLQRNTAVKAQYSAFIKEYEQLRHMSIIDQPIKNTKVYYLPHHCVFKSDSSTTKLRVVFDGSAVSSSGYSLNEILMAGPTIQPKLADILIRFRSHPVAVTGDICKMYRCVRVAPPDNYLQCILWRDDSNSEIKTFKLETVTYGTKPASFLAIRTMHQLAADEKQSFPLGSQIVLRDFYVDDLITGAKTIDDARTIVTQTSQLLAKGNFQIRKWCSSHNDVLSHIAVENRESFLKFDDGSNITKTLGLLWNPQTDTFLFSFSLERLPPKITKRAVLSIIARFYDPLGLIGPIISKAKIFLQRLWMEKLNWDESLPISLHTIWQQLHNELEEVKGFSFPRFVSIIDAKIEVHAFCDASILAYGVCVYIRSMNEHDIQTSLLCSKSRVAPLKTLTVPKLELCAAALLAQVVEAISRLGIFECNFFCWSDSSIVLSWLKEEPGRFNIFVANRVGSIQQLTKGMEWRYIPSALNPADILSRGATATELLKSSLWKSGPPFLAQSSSTWPTSYVQVNSLPEMRKGTLLASYTFFDSSTDCKYINSFSKMQRIYGYVYKFLNRDDSNTLSPLHIQKGTFYLLRMIQRVHFPTEYTALQRKQPISSHSSLFSLSPFLDDFGLLRVGGRLKNASLDFNSRHPILLPKRHPLTISIITHFHKKLLHAGPQSLLASVRLQYWPLGGRKTVSYVVNKCVLCFRCRPRLMEQIMADLPKERVQTARAFLTTGVDFCGPFYYNSEVRNRPPTKCYICLFVCFATKAVHMELVKDLSTSAFLAALQRFVSLRGKPKTIWSDNATNFVGARNELAELKRLFLNSDHQQMVHQLCLEEGIDWKFIPPRSPHFGGLWEAAIKAAKYHFNRVVGLSILTYDQLRTLICQISAILNSRPLTPITEHIDDLDVLTPAHFLTGGPLTAIPDPDITELNINRLSLWQRISSMHQTFWKKWSTEYLTQLQQRAKWRSPKVPIPIGALVLIKDENLPPLRWPIARVIETNPGSDGVARVALLKTSTGMTKRAISKLCLLPMENSVESSIFQRGEDVS